jgi:hypothetical protein
MNGVDLLGLPHRQLIQYFVSDIWAVKLQRHEKIELILAVIYCIELAISFQLLPAGGGGGLNKEGSIRID